MMTSIYCHRDDCLLSFFNLPIIMLTYHIVNSLHSCNFSSSPSSMSFLEGMMIFFLGNKKFRGGNTEIEPRSKSEKAYEFKKSFRQEMIIFRQSSFTKILLIFFIFLYLSFSCLIISRMLSIIYLSTNHFSLGRYHKTFAGGPLLEFSSELLSSSSFTLYREVPQIGHLDISWNSCL